MNVPGEGANAQAAEPPEERQRSQHDLLAAIAVAKQAGGEHRRRQHEQVAGLKPLQVGLRRMQRPGQRGQATLSTVASRPNGEHARVTAPSAHHLREIIQRARVGPDSRPQSSCSLGTWNCAIDRSLTDEAHELDSFLVNLVVRASLARCSLTAR